MVSIATFSSGISLLVEITLSETSLFLLQQPLHKNLSIFTVRQGKHDAIKLLTKSNLDNIADVIFQAKQDDDISSTEFCKVLQEIEIYRKLKTDIRHQAKTKLRKITKEQ